MAENRKILFNVLNRGKPCRIPGWVLRWQKKNKIPRIIRQQKTHVLQVRLFDTKQRVIDGRIDRRTVRSTTAWTAHILLYANALLKREVTIADAWG